MLPSHFVPSQRPYHHLVCPSPLTGQRIPMGIHPLLYIKSLQGSADFLPGKPEMSNCVEEHIT